MKHPYYVMVITLIIMVYWSMRRYLQPPLSSTFLFRLKIRTERFFLVTWESHQQIIFENEAYN
jgi:hypothetical protein